MSRTTPLFILQPKGTPIMSGDEVFRAVMSRFGPEEWTRHFRLYGVLPALFEHARWLIDTGGKSLTPTVYISVEPAFSLEHGMRSFTIDAVVDMLIAEGWIQSDDVDRSPLTTDLPADWTPDLPPRRPPRVTSPDGTPLRELSEDERAKLLAQIAAMTPEAS